MPKYFIPNPFNDIRNVTVSFGELTVAAETATTATINLRKAFRNLHPGFNSARHAVLEGPNDQSKSIPVKEIKPKRRIIL